MAFVLAGVTHDHICTFLYQYPSRGIDMDLIEQFQTLGTRFLLALHHGDVDAVAVARRELAMRGLDGTGRWVGFAQAGERLGI
ncbi:hypothetical protein [Xanthomonas oryzae]|uniref:hypothetical protein n=1 Tax=Xanthomonas oryzae TaxID=347 RepID=UPI001049D734|nr:hypothetical protein [Xanthomonas oryzae]QBG84044.1 hypothetical protein EYR27_09250 [Xanthomonas oryzae]